MSKSNVMPVLDEQITVIEQRRADLVREVMPSFSPEFIAMLTEKASETLYARLKKAGDVESVQLLDHLVALLAFPEKLACGKVQAFVDNDIVAVAGELSYLVNWDG